MEKTHRSIASMINVVPPPTAAHPEDVPTADDTTQVKKSVKDVIIGGLSPLAAAFGSSKPANFFELLAAAMSAKKIQQQKVPDFIEYLKTSGVKMAWIRAIVSLYEEPKKPDDPLAYILKLMGLGIPEQIDVKRMQDQVARLRVKLLQLQAENVQLHEDIDAEEEALRKKEEIISLYDENLFFSEYNSDDDYSDAEEMQLHHSNTKQQTPTTV